MFGWTAMEDSELLSYLKDGNVRAFDTIYARYWADLYKHACCTLRNREQALDIIQEVFTWLWVNRETVQITSLKQYLKGAVRFKMANYLRASKSQKQLINSLQYLAEDTVAPVDIHLKELQSLIASAVDALPEKCKEVYSMSRHEQLSHAEIASRLNISVKTVENQISIALKRIRIHIGSTLLSLLLLLL
ncbi:RNA polymerase sigma-70 factor, ECF subfamily [Chitinophaga jiangningensis]|uniref:RNA polymerase sigma-70 factor, ECF subfamily n=1 Tax=Chitinophaga jiangningensis TaxID=1419482 RepID=A0A1M7FPN9_9BACT|nr:RNA polymerase sigma-70 factor [Chitinophaga jiangningensis]SHM06014.1 RNA polymerase sigma-70 factor, ECF subfamily [Chitinophaga jiangningensis]